MKAKIKTKAKAKKVDVKKFARDVGGKRKGQVKVGSGYFGAAQFVAEVSLAEQAYRRIRKTCKRHGLGLRQQSVSSCAIGRLSASYRSNFFVAMRKGLNGFTAVQIQKIESGFESYNGHTRRLLVDENNEVSEVGVPTTWGRDSFFLVGRRLAEEALNDQHGYARSCEVTVA